MSSLLGRIPLPVMLAAILAASMYVPAIHASLSDAHHEARGFFYSGTLLLALTAALAIATARPQSKNVTRSHLVALLMAYTLLPVMAALPLSQIVEDTRFLNAYVEMVAAMTTTGGSLFAADRLGESVHLWRALVAWQGGFLTWVAAIAILAPLNLGGFEVTEGNTAIRLGQDPDRLRGRVADPEARIRRAFASLAPIYLGLTLALWAILGSLGADGTTALIFAMSTLSTSGIIGQTGIATSAAGTAGEVAVAGFLIFALSRQTFTTDMNRDHNRHLTADRELRIAGMIIGTVALVLLIRHWIGAYGVGAGGDILAALGALWGSIFTVLSFLTTTGFESQHWQAAQGWSGLGAPTVLLLGLAMFGGGVATTAGGVKLLRIYTLYAHGKREMDLLVHPSLVIGGKGALARIPKGGIEGAWVFFMLFATSIAVVTLLLTTTGLTFEAALTLAVACLTTTGQLVEMVLGGREAVQALTDPAKIIAAMTMVLGRLEALAFIALLNPAFWRE